MVCCLWFCRTARGCSPLPVQFGYVPRTTHHVYGCILHAYYVYVLPSWLHFAFVGLHVLPVPHVYHAFTTHAFTTTATIILTHILPRPRHLTPDSHYLWDADDVTHTLHLVRSRLVVTLPTPAHPHTYTPPHTTLPDHYHTFQFIHGCLPVHIHTLVCLVGLPGYYRHGYTTPPTCGMIYPHCLPPPFFTLTRLQHTPRLHGRCHFTILPTTHATHIPVGPFPHHTPHGSGHYHTHGYTFGLIPTTFPGSVYDSCCRCVLGHLPITFWLPTLGYYTTRLRTTLHLYITSTTVYIYYLCPILPVAIPHG